MHTIHQQAMFTGRAKNCTHEERAENLQLRIWDQDSPGREAVEAFIHARFRDCYAADVSTYMPHLLGVLNDGNEICAAVGFRPAGIARLFLESYLELPAEWTLSTACAFRVQRQQIVEVGNLASTGRRSFRFLMTGMVTLLDRLPDVNWMMCTVGERKFRLLQRGRFFPLVLGEANPQHLSPQQGNWGSYFQNVRKIVAGNVSYGLRELKRRNIWCPEFAHQVNLIIQNGWRT